MFNRFRGYSSVAPPPASRLESIPANPRVGKGKGTTYSLSPCLYGDRYTENWNRTCTLLYTVQLIWNRWLWLGAVGGATSTILSPIIRAQKIWISRNKSVFNLYSGFLNPVLRITRASILWTFEHSLETRNFQPGRWMMVDSPKSVDAAHCILSELPRYKMNVKIKCHTSTILLP